MCKLYLATVTLFNLLPSHPDRFTKQLYYFDNLHDYSASDNFADTYEFKYSHGEPNTVLLRNIYSSKGIFQRIPQQDYRLLVTAPIVYKRCIHQLFTLTCKNQSPIASTTPVFCIYVCYSMGEAGKPTKVAKMNIV